MEPVPEEWYSDVPVTEPCCFFCDPKDEAASEPTGDPEADLSDSPSSRLIAAEVRYMLPGPLRP